jgi:hypothetical protein
MTKPTTLTAERVRELLTYEPLTGLFYWRVDRRCGRGRGRVTANAGSQAGTPFLGAKGRRYWKITIDARCYLAHRIAVLCMMGAWPEHEVDHIDGNGLSNAWANLRPATRAQNGANTSRRSDNTVGLKGVTRQGSRFVAQLQRGKRHVYLGAYDTAEEAHAAYVAAAKQHFGEFARAA